MWKNSNIQSDYGLSSSRTPQTQIKKDGDSAILFHGENLLNYTEKQMTHIRGSKISMIFQDPMTSLNPTMKIGNQIMESILIHQKISKKEAEKQALRDAGAGKNSKCSSAYETVSI